MSNLTPMPMLYRAEELINGERQNEYGDKLPNFSQIAALWTAHLMFKLAPDQTISAEDVALMMINVKQARLSKSPNHADSIIDIAGYAGCYDKIQEERAQKQNYEYYLANKKEEGINDTDSDTIPF